MPDQHSPQGNEGITDHAREKAGEAQQKLQEGTERARSTVAEQIDQRTGKASDQMRASAGALQDAADHLREQGQEVPAKVADRAAQQGERIADYLRDTNGNRFLHDAEDFGRKRPGVVIGAGLLAGFLLSRLLKASSEQRYRAGAAVERPGRAPAPRSVPQTTAVDAAAGPITPATTSRPTSSPSPVGVGDAPGGRGA